MSMLTKVAFFTARPGQNDTLGQRLLALVGPTGQEPGCVHYDVHQSSDSAGDWFVHKAWRSPTDLNGHMQTPYVQAFMNGRHALCSEAPRYVRSSAARTRPSAEVDYCRRSFP